jgi:ribosomal protein L11 methyltransferase
MSAYIEITIAEPDSTRRDLLVPTLEAWGFEGFTEEDKGLKAYIPQGNLDESAFEAWAQTQLPGMERRVLPEQNWNATWESNFDPVRIGDFCAIRADFHEPIPGVTHEIVITPKMSFGTGHHATTRLMIEHMRSLPFAEARVIDFGTGTGVLAILAERLGAASVEALDSDHWSIENAGENMGRNGARRIILQARETVRGLGPADIILANINRPVLLSEMDEFAEVLTPGGWLLLSGILESDALMVAEAARRAGFSEGAPRATAAPWVAQLWKK